MDMWRTAVDRDRKEIEFQKIAGNLAESGDGDGNEGGGGGRDLTEQLEKKSEEFSKILEVSKEERDRIQRLQVIDRAAAAIAAARAILEERNGSVMKNGESPFVKKNSESNGAAEVPPFVKNSERNGTAELSQRGKVQNF